MSPAETTQALAAAGLILTFVGGKLGIRGERSAYSPTLRAAVEMNRGALVEHLSAGDAGNAGDVLPATHASHVIFSDVISNTFLGDKRGDYPHCPHPPQTHEIASLPVAMTRDLPAPCTLLVLLGGRQAPSVLTSSAARGELERAAHRAVWSPGEYELAAFAVQEGRAGAQELAAWDERKVRTRGGWALTVQEALGGAVGLLEAWGLPIRRGVHTHGRIPTGALTLTWGQLLRRIGAELVSVECEREASVGIAAPSAAQADTSAVDALL